jgi:hypothetical protein
MRTHAHAGHFPVLFGMLLLFPSVGLLAIGQAVGALLPAAEDCWQNVTSSGGSSTLAPMTGPFYDDCRFNSMVLMVALSVVSCIAAVRVVCCVRACVPVCVCAR